MTEFTQSTLLAAAHQFSCVVSDIIEAAHDEEIKSFGNIGCGDTFVLACDGLRLFIEATDDTDDADADINRLHALLVEILDLGATEEEHQ